MEEAFEKLKKEGKTDVESLVKWMKDCKIIEDAKTAEERASAYFKDVADQTSVKMDEFKEALSKEAEVQKKNVQELIASLGDQKLRFANALTAGVSAFKEALTKK